MTGTQVRNVHWVLQKALNYAVRLGYIARNPTEAAVKPREDTEERPVYTPLTADPPLHGRMEGDRPQAMWYLVFATGLGRAEQAALDRDPPTLAVRSTRTTAGPDVAEYDLQSGSSRPVLCLDAGTADVLPAGSGPPSSRRWWRGGQRARRAPPALHRSSPVVAGGRRRMAPLRRLPARRRRPLPTISAIATRQFQ